MIDEQKLQDVLSKVDSQEEALTEGHVEDAISVIRNKDDEDEPSPEWLAEVMAFGFCENYQSSGTGWGTYFGPMMVMRDESGETVESPSIQLVTPEMLEYWAKRAREAKHPGLHPGI